ncbi:MAG: hypothetical protein D6701_13215, partial [Gemmatimonadetes bacterium]
AEWAREDFANSVREFLENPRRSSAITAGIGQVLDLGAGRWLRLRAELTDLRSKGMFIPWSRFYTHFAVRQGHTHNGQLLGASLGPGSNAQYLEVDLYAPFGRIGGFVERAERDTDTFEERFEDRFDRDQRDIEYTVGVRQTLFLGTLDVAWSASASRRRSRTFIGLDGPGDRGIRETNVSLDVSASYWPGR